MEKAYRVLARVTVQRQLTHCWMSCKANCALDGVSLSTDRAARACLLHTACYRLTRFNLHSYADG